MADIKWIKIATDMFEDEKIDFIASLPESDGIIVIWIRLLTLAGKCNAGGYVFLTEKIPYTDEMLAHKFKKPINTIKLALETFRKLEMIEMDEHGIFLPNWEKHQEVDKLEMIRERTRLRVEAHRNKKRQELLIGNVTVTDDVTLGNAIEPDKELDIEQDNKKDNPPLFDQFWDGYPRKVRKQDSVKSWKAVIKAKHDPHEIIQAAINYSTQCLKRGTSTEYILHPPTFLNKERWKDYLCGPDGDPDGRPPKGDGGNGGPNNNRSLSDRFTKST